MKAILSTLFLSLFLVGCVGEQVTVQPGEVGRQLTDDGLEDELYDPGVFRLDHCWDSVEACPKLVRLQTQKATKEFTIDKLFLPKSNVDMTKVHIGIQFQVRMDDESINKAFSEVRPNYGDSDVELLISADELYKTFLQRKAPDAIITALREYTVEQVLSEVPEISEHCKKKVNEMLADTPVEVTELGFPNGIGEPPPEVLDAKRRLYAVEEQKARDIKALKAALIVEEHMQRVQGVRAKNDKENAATAGTDYATYTFLKTMERFAEEGVPLGLMPQVPAEVKAQPRPKTPKPEPTDG